MKVDFENLSYTALSCDTEAHAESIFWQGFWCLQVFLEEGRVEMKHSNLEFIENKGHSFVYLQKAREIVLHVKWNIPGIYPFNESSLERSCPCACINGMESNIKTLSNYCVSSEEHFFHLVV